MGTLFGVFTLAGKLIGWFDLGIGGNSLNLPEEIADKIRVGQKLKFQNNRTDAITFAYVTRKAESAHQGQIILILRWFKPVKKEPR